VLARYSREQVRLDAGATSWTLVTRPFWPTARVQVGAWRSWNEAWAPEISIDRFHIDGPVVLEGRELLLPGSNELGYRSAPLVVPDESRRWFTFGPHGVIGTPSLVQGQDAEARDTYTLDYDDLSFPGLVLDRDGQPHVGFALQSGTTTGDLQHLFWNGTTWQTEIIATGVQWWDESQYWLGAEGLVQALWASNLYDTKAHHALRTADGWTVAEVPPSSIKIESRVAAFGPDGTTYVFAMDWARTSCVLQRRTAAGDWSETPVGACASGPFYQPMLAPGADGHVAILMETGGGTPDLWFVQDAGEGFSNAEFVTRCDPFADPKLTMRPDGSRPVVVLSEVIDSREMVRLGARTQAGWEWVTLGPGAERVTPGYYQDGKLWVVASLNEPDNASGTVFRDVLLEEP
jgi:hypothetical protein